MTARKILFQFPGQGSQYRGMGSDLVTEFRVARDVYERSSEVLGYDLAKLSFEDPEDKLKLTRFTQPALLAHHMACLAAFRSLAEDVEPIVAAGHSLGEYSALVAAGALGLEDAVSLVAERGRLMSELGRGSMIATTLDLDTAKALAERHYCGVAGSNLPDQTVIAGADEDLESLAQDLKENFARARGIELKTEGAFHTYLMVGAAEKFRALLEKCELGQMRFPVLSNYTGELHPNEPGAIRSRLFFQLFNPVRWFACMRRAVEANIDTIVEFGGGIGKGDSPAQKRPNLESVAKKSLKAIGHEAEYFGAINVDGIRDAAKVFTAG